MRRILVVATLGLAFVSAAACSDDTPSASPTGTATATAAAPTAAADLKTACASLKKASDDFKAKVIEFTPKLIAAEADNSKAPAVAAEALQALQEFTAAYGSNASAINDPQLKAAVDADLKALNDVVTKAIAAGPDIAKLQASFDAQDFENVGEAVERRCATA
ncbi:hypothetical protein F4553_004425 [Allocatelliglobosispora scoriae]|uniref:Small secreted protein n=1 Tax=Allocatelliglobosispora scoriae TaxID=643052 RepID=A0A841BUC5_9ACTN|nr:hypothetical protein [Allocatelliglobosispora scoriae]MBB5871046.1 hypothetical protein [Allocatelliglobosispora scoriae]